jgi:hypothetical protein
MEHRPEPADAAPDRSQPASMRTSVRPTQGRSGRSGSCAVRAGRRFEHEPVAGTLEHARLELRGMRTVVIDRDGAAIGVDRDDRHRELIHREVLAIREHRVQDRRAARGVRSHRVGPDPRDQLRIPTAAAAAAAGAVYRPVPPRIFLSSPKNRSISSALV